MSSIGSHVIDRWRAREVAVATVVRLADDHLLRSPSGNVGPKVPCGRTEPPGISTEHAVGAQTRRRQGTFGPVSGRSIQ